MTILNFLKTKSSKSQKKLSAELDKELEEVIKEHKTTLEDTMSAYNSGCCDTLTQVLAAIAEVLPDKVESLDLQGVLSVCEKIRKRRDDLLDAGEGENK